ncbi:MAG: hypothetical protein MRY74_04375 [Neomegalonema sp.]|nr:hypothetical protein [Neomegalonema sp.]
MAPNQDQIDPRNLITEAFRMEGLSIEQCRSIFLDWALGLPEEIDATACVAALIKRHGDAPQDHPMLTVLKEGTTRRARSRPSAQRRQAE